MSYRTAWMLCAKLRVEGKQLPLLRARARARGARNWSCCSAAGNRALVQAPAHITGREDSHEKTLLVQQRVRLRLMI
jgi:hypothetical protein